MKKTPRFKAIIACGPVIIEKINGKKCVLLDKHGEKIWKFPGSSIHKGENAEQCAIKRVKEELGINVKLIKPLKPVIIWRKGEAVVLIHFKKMAKSNQQSTSSNGHGFLLINCQRIAQKILKWF